MGKEKKKLKKKERDHGKEQKKKREEKGKEKEEGSDSGASSGDNGGPSKKKKKKREMGGMGGRKESFEELSLGSEKGSNKRMSLQLSKVVPQGKLLFLFFLNFFISCSLSLLIDFFCPAESQRRSAKKPAPGHKREKIMFPCLLGYTLLTFECPIQLADQARTLFLRFFKEFIEKEDIRFLFYSLSSFIYYLF